MTLSEDLTANPAPAVRLGLDLGGTKISAALLSREGAVLARKRVPNPGAYDELLVAVRDLCDALVPRTVPLGVGIPGSISPATGLVRNCNSTFINGRDLAADLTAAAGRDVRLANDANCFALSEATDGAAAGASCVFGVIIGTGVGGGVVVEGRVLNGAGGIAGEWGHVPLPWPGAHETPGPTCWCGLRGCMETWVSGPALERDYALPGLGGSEIAARALAGEPEARAALNRYVSRLGRGLAMICNVLDPEVIVLGGGVSNMDALYVALPDAMRPFLFTDRPANRVLRNRHGDDSGVRGAAWLWSASRTED